MNTASPVFCFFFCSSQIHGRNDTPGASDNSSLFSTEWFQSSSQIHSEGGISKMVENRNIKLVWVCVTLLTAGAVVLFISKPWGRIWLQINRHQKHNKSFCFHLGIMSYHLEHNWTYCHLLLKKNVCVQLWEFHVCFWTDRKVMFPKNGKNVQTHRPVGVF